MTGAATPEWRVREDAGESVLVALYLRQMLGIRFPDELPSLRGIPPRTTEPHDADAVERQWRAYWAMTVEPLANPSPVPLELVNGFGTHLALPEGTDELRTAVAPHGAGALAYARSEHERYRATTGGSYRAYAAALAEHERRVGRRAHTFDLTVQVLPLAQRGLWWIGDLTVAVTDGLRHDVAAFDSAIQPVIAELA